MTHLWKSLLNRNLLALVVFTLLASCGQVLADDRNAVPNDPFILLLHGLFNPCLRVRALTSA